MIYNTQYQLKNCLCIFSITLLLFSSMALHNKQNGKSLSSYKLKHMIFKHSSKGEVKGFRDSSHDDPHKGFHHSADYIAKHLGDDLPFSKEIEVLTEDMFSMNTNPDNHDPNVDRNLVMIVDFYAPWCPHCQRFAPVWGDIAASFSNFSNKVVFGCLNCVKYKSTCRTFGVKGFPTIKPLFWNREMGLWVPAFDSKTKEWPYFQGEKKVQYITDWVTSTFKQHYGIDVHSSGPQIVEEKLSKTVVPVTRVRDTDLRTTLYRALWVGVFVSKNDLNGKRAEAMKLWLTVIMESLPQETQDLSILLQLLSDSSDVKESTWLNHLHTLTLFGSSWDNSQEWEICEGDHHKYPCGLWELFHTIVVRAPNNKGVDALRGIVAFVKEFFSCISCRDHFLSMTTALPSTNEKAIEFLWKIHNQVSERLAPDWGFEVAEVLWPPMKSCPKCRNENGEWKSQIVYNFLQTIYGVAVNQDQNVP